MGEIPPIAMTEALHSAKAALRQQVRERLMGLTPQQRAEASTRICGHLRQHAAWQTARSILFFASMPAEPDLWPLLKESLHEGKTVALPRFSSAGKVYLAAQIQNLEKDLRRGQLGIREPTETCLEFPLDELDLILVPGVAFDLACHRIGWGKGYYDRMLANVRGIKCGVAFDEQIVDAVPVGSHDVQLDHVITPTRSAQRSQSER